MVNDKWTTLHLIQGASQLVRSSEVTCLAQGHLDTQLGFELAASTHSFGRSNKAVLLKSLGAELQQADAQRRYDLR